MRIATVLPSPNQRMNTGTQASEGIGIRALASGSTKFSTARNRPIRMPSGSADDDREREAEQHAVERRCRVAEHACRRRATPTSVPATFGRVGIRAGANQPERASAS